MNNHSTYVWKRTILEEEEALLKKEHVADLVDRMKAQNIPIQSFVIRNMVMGPMSKNAAEELIKSLGEWSL